VIRELVARDPKLWLSRSWTTRPRRPGEADDAYTFVGKEQFIAHAKAGGFLEWATVLGQYYGTPVPDPPPGHDVVLEIDIQGAEQVLERCTDVVCVLLVPPSREDQEARLRGRGDSDEHVRRRLELGEVEFARGQRIADKVVVNDDLDRTVDEFAGIVESARREANG
jgi:guanylate kinase